MVLTFLFFGSFVAAITLVVFSAWLASRAAYLGILGLLGAALVLAELREGLHATSLLALCVNLIVFGAFLYFVSVQYLMGRKVTHIATRDEFKQAMIASGRFSGPVKALYHLPILLLLGGIFVALVGALQAK